MLIEENLQNLVEKYEILQIFTIWTGAGILPSTVSIAENKKITQQKQSAKWEIPQSYHKSALFDSPKMGSISWPLNVESKTSPKKETSNPTLNRNPELMGI